MWMCVCVCVVGGGLELAKKGAERQVCVGNIYVCVCVCVYLYVGMDRLTDLHRLQIHVTITHQTNHSKQNHQALEAEVGKLESGMQEAEERLTRVRGFDGWTGRKGWEQCTHAPTHPRVGPPHNPICSYAIILYCDYSHQIFRCGRRWPRWRRSSAPTSRSASSRR